MKALLIIALYAVAMLAIASAMRIAPDMTWPTNGLEMQAAALLVIGMLAKLAGHVTLLSMTGAR